MESFIKEPVDFKDVEGSVAYKDSVKASIIGGKASKTITRTYKMADGSTKKVGKTVTKEIPN